MKKLFYKCYRPHRFSASSQIVLEDSVKIIKRYFEQGYDLTLRQLYYRFVAGDLFPDDRKWRKTSEGRWVRDPNGTKNADPNYDWLGMIINDGRLAGKIPWNSIVDRTREMCQNSHWEGPSEIIRASAESFRIDTRSNQENYVEVWVEKEALVNVLERVCKEQDVPYMACRGYVSQSTMWESSLRFIKAAGDGRTCTILHLGDHDPSGIDMTRDIQDRLNMFYADVKVRRIALTMAQVQAFQPPPNPAKVTDSRCESYIAMYGEESWELDALEPQVITNLIATEVEALTNMSDWQDKLDEQELGGSLLNKVSENWDDVVQSLEKKDDE